MAVYVQEFTNFDIPTNVGLQT